MKSIVLAVAVAVAVVFSGVANAQPPADTVNYTISCAGNFTLGADVTIEGGGTFHVAGNSNVSGTCSRNAPVFVTAAFNTGCNFNIGNGGGWEIYSSAPFVIGVRYLGGGE